MKRILFVVIVASILAGCSKDEGLKSAEGKWTYTTPDGKIAVEFELVKSGTTWSVTNTTIKLEGTLYNSAVTSDGVNPPGITMIRINANDSKAVYPYNIVFNNGVVNADNTEIKVPGATYTWPYGKTNSLTDITITRP